MLYRTNGKLNLNVGTMKILRENCILLMETSLYGLNNYH